MAFSGPLTIRAFSAVSVDVQLFIPLECLFEESYLLLALDLPGCGIGTALLVAFHLVQLHHLLDALQVLLLDIQFKLDLREHELDARPKVGCIIFDQVLQEHASVLGVQL